MVSHIILVYIVSDVTTPAEDGDPDSTQTLSVDGVEIVEVTQAWDSDADELVETITIGTDTVGDALGTAWDGIEISAVKGGTGLKVDEITKGDVLISPVDNEWDVLNGLGTVTEELLEIIASDGTVNGLQILLSDAIAAGLFTTDGDAITGDTTADGTVEAVTYTNNLLNAPGLESEIALGNFPAAPTGAFLSLGHDHSFSWETRIDGGEF